MTDLDTRLRAHYASLVTTFSGDAPLWAGDASGRPRTRRHVWLLALAAAALVVTVSILGFRLFQGGSSATTVTLQVPGFTVVAAADSTVTPHMTAEQATAAARAWLARPSSGTFQFTGFAVTSVTFEAGVQSVTQQCGPHIRLNAAGNLWVIVLRAPPQQGWQWIQAGVLIDDNSGQIAGHGSGAQLMLGRSGPPGC